MLRSLIPAAALILAAALSCPAQPQHPAEPPAQFAPTNPAPSSTLGAKTADPAPESPKDNASQSKKKPKKVWTNDELSQINGNISVVGGSVPASSTSPASATNPAKNSTDKDAAASAVRDKQLAAYRDQLRQLRIQMETTDKYLSGVRNFNGDNSSSSGGINMNQNYSTTPVEDLVKQLEAKKIQLQEQIDSVESDARKNGFNPGDLR